MSVSARPLLRVGTEGQEAMFTTAKRQRCPSTHLGEPSASFSGHLPLLLTIRLVSQQDHGHPLYTCVLHTGYVPSEDASHKVEASRSFYTPSSHLDPLFFLLAYKILLPLFMANLVGTSHWKPFWKSKQQGLSLAELSL